MALRSARVSNPCPGVLEPPLSRRMTWGEVVGLHFRKRLAVMHTRPFILLALLLLAANSAPAQTFPTHGVTIISPYQAGGTSDIIARALAQKLGETWSQPVVVENRPGANGAIGVQAVARAPADGHTLLAVASSALTL